MATKARKPATPKYQYTATKKDTGELILHGGLSLTGTHPDHVKKAAAVVAPKVPVRVVRYVLESSVRPGGE